MPNEKRDYYEILGLARGCDSAELKKAYKRLAKQHHPDLNPGDHQAEDRFKELAEAYAVLSDANKRELYDRYGHQGPRQAGFEGFTGVEDILSRFADMFGGGGFGFGFGGERRRGPQVEAGEDLQAEMTVSFEEAAHGVSKPLEVTRLARCATCRGTGGKANSQPMTCGTCEGRGQVHHRQGIFVISAECPSCHGRGRVVRDKCDACEGGGVQREAETLTIEVPAGIDEGQTLRVVGKGQASPSGGAAGHLYVTFHVEADERFDREGDHLLTRVELTFAQAALGARVQVPTLDGEVELDIPAGTQPGTVRVLRGRGMPNVHGRGRGDLAVELSVAVPRALGAEQRRLVEELAKLDPAAAPRSRSRASREDEGGFSLFGRKKKKQR